MSLLHVAGANTKAFEYPAMTKAITVTADISMYGVVNYQCIKHSRYRVAVACTYLRREVPLMMRQGHPNL